MKKILLFISILSFVLSSCDKEDVEEIFDKSPEERVSEQLNTVRTDLMSNEMGWLSTYQFGAEEQVLLIKFIDETRAEITNAQSGEKMESGYTLRYTQQLNLIFDTYNYLSDNVNKGADFRWELERNEDGKYYFNSRADKSEGDSKMMLEKATSENLKVALDIQILKSRMRVNLNISYFRVLELESGERFDYSYQSDLVRFEYIQDDEIVHFESSVTINDKGFTLDKPFVVNGKSISDFEYDAESGKFKIVNAEIKGEIKFTDTPVIMPLGLDSYLNTANYLLYIPSISKDNCSPVFQNYLTDLETKGYLLSRMEMSLTTKKLYININGTWHTMAYSDVKEDGLLKLTFAGTNIEDEDLFNALLPMLQAIFGAKGQYFINEKDYFQYKGFSLLSKDYPNMKIHMIALK